MRAMLLAAGSGTRMRPLTDTLPKPLAPIANQPLLQRTLTWLRAQGVGDVVVNASHLSEQIVDFVGDGSLFGLTASVSVETELLGTSGAVRNCSDSFVGSPFFVIYGDNLIDADLHKLRSFHESSDAEVTIALFTPPDISACGAVEYKPGGRVTRFVEKPKPGESNSIYANAGIYIIEPHLISTIPTGFSDFGNDIFPRWLQDGIKVFATELGGYLQDTGTPERYRIANWDVMKGELSQQPFGSRAEQSVIDQNCEIDQSTSLLFRNSIGADVVIAERCVLTDCIIWPGAKIGSDCKLTNVIVGQNANIGVGTVADSTILV